MNPWSTAQAVRTGRIVGVARRLVLLVAVLSLATMLSMTVAADDSPEELTECAEIDESGTYELQNDVSSDGTCLEITADDVVFDGQGHTITGGDEGFSPVSAVNVFGDDNVTVTNVTIDGDSDVGVSVSNIENAFLTNITVDRSGIGRHGVRVDNTDELTVQDVEITGYSGGIRLRVVDGFTIESASVEGGGQDGIELLGASNGTIQDVVGADKGDSVVAVPDTMMGTTSNVTMDNVTATESGTGIHLESGDVGHISITNSTAIDNDGSGFVLEAEDVKVSDSLTIDNGEYGIRLEEPSDTTITNVEARENTDNALRVDGSPNVSVEQLDIGDSTAANTTLSIAEATDVEVGDTTAPGETPLDLVSTDRYVQTESVSEEGTLTVSVRYEGSDVLGVNESTLSMWAYDGEWSEYEGTTVDTDAQSISGTIENVSTVGVFGEEAELSPSFTVDPDHPDAGDQITFDASESSSTSGDLVEYRWDVTDDGEIDETTADPETTWTYDEAGEYTVTLEIEDQTGETAQVSEAVTVEDKDGPDPGPAPSPDSEPAISVNDTSVDETSIVAGDEVTVTVVLENTGDADGEYEAILTVDGEPVTDEPVSVAAGELAETSVTHTFESAGEYELHVDDVEVGVVTVQPVFADIDRDPETNPMWNADEELLEIPQHAAVDIDGVTNTADGTNLTVVIDAQAGQDTAFYQTHNVNSNPAETNNTWSITDDFDDVHAGTELSLLFHREDATGTINPDGEPVSAVVVGTDTSYFDIRDLTSSVSIDEPGDSASISATIENTDDGTDTQTVEVTLDGETVETVDISLESDESQDVVVDLDTRSLAFDATYEYTVSSDNDSETGILTIAPESDDSDTDIEGTEDDTDDSEADAEDLEDEADEQTTEEDTPGFGITVAVLALLTAAVLARR